LRKNKSAVKRAKVALRNRERNVAFISAIRTAIKKVRAAIEQKLAVAEVQVTMNQVHSLLDRAVLKGILHKNTAARYKSRLMKRIFQYQQAATATV
jgi:small subunit ribosomal protein S20